MRGGRTLRDSDWTIWSIALFLSAVGVMQIYSATRGSIWRGAWSKQAFSILLGILLAYLISRVDYHTLLGQVPLLYGTTIVLLLITYLAGPQIFGSRRWIPLPGGFSFQISEFAKLVIILLVARYLSAIRNDRVDRGQLLKLCGLVAVPMALVMKQPDLGTSLTFVPILMAGIVLLGLRWQHWLAVAVVGLVLIPVVWNYYLLDYQKRRLSTFVDPGQDPRGKGYQLIQSKIAVGSGGAWGKGVAMGSQTQLRFLPAPHTDFIMAAFAEEHGFAGVIVLLGLYMLLILQVTQNARFSSDKAGMFICMGAAMMLLFHVLVNAGMVIGRMPVTGIPMPLMSYGGCSVLTTFMTLGLVNNVRLRRYVN
ncbi:MAG: rod shape-determining protein RodA [Candidatus Solibacter usitatus]|nr:rod shape-determining protein RodA [Candidatus Solibacter usitatus]